MKKKSLFVGCLIMGLFFSNACIPEEISECLFENESACQPNQEDSLLEDGQIETDSTLAVSKLPVRD